MRPPSSCLLCSLTGAWLSPQMPGGLPGLRWGSSSSRGLVYPPQQVTREGQERRPLPPLCPDRSGRGARSRSRGKGPASKRTAQCHGCSQLAPCLSRLPIAALPPSSSLHAFLSQHSHLFSSCPPLSFNSPLSFSFYLSPPFSSLSFLPSFLSMGLAPCCSCCVSGSVSLRLCPLMSSRSLSGPGPAEG